MNFGLALNLLLILSLLHNQANAQTPDFDKSAYYKVIETGKLNEIDAQLDIVRKSPSTEKEAYEGAILMKKAGLVEKVKDKMSLFKVGCSKLELSITKDIGNTEYRFLRLIIQEHAPKIVKYRNELETDSEMIRKNFKNLSQFLQRQIIDYSKVSKFLKIS